MQTDIKIGFIGAGNMATALAKGLLSAGVANSQDVVASDIDEGRREAFRKATSAAVTDNNAEVVQASDVVVLAVKPQQIGKLLQELGPSFQERHVIISIAAGIPTAFIEKFLRNGVRVIRAMPNTPMLLGAGAAAVCKGKWATDADLDLAKSIFESCAVVALVEEKDMDAVTAVSGSGPAYFFYLTEMMIKAGVELGLSQETAALLARNTAFGAGKMLAEAEESAAELRRRVTSPGGTTEAALRFMDNAQVPESVADAVKAAAKRSMELGEQVG